MGWLFCWEDGDEEDVLFTKGIVFTDPQVQVQRQELLDLSSAMGGRNPEGLCPPSDLTRHKAERTVGRLIEEAHRETLRLLEEHREELDELASRLLHRVGIAGDEVREVVGRRRMGEEEAAAAKKKKKEESISASQSSRSSGSPSWCRTPW